MTKTKWFILTAGLFIVAGIGLTVVIALAFGFFAGNPEAAAASIGLPVYQSDQTISSHPGYRRNTLTCGANVFVNDYEEDCLQLATTEPTPMIGVYTIGAGKVCGIPGQPVTAYIAGDVGSEMPRYVPYRAPGQPAFDWRKAVFHEMTADRRGWRNQYISTTNAALLAEVVRNLRDEPTVSLPPFPFVGVTNFTNLRITIDQLPGLLFSPYVYVVNSNTIYIAESLMFDDSSGHTQLNAHWVVASPTLTLWLNSN